MEGAAIDWVIKLGDLLVVASLIFYIGRFSKRVDAMEKTIERIEGTHQSIASAITTVAVQKVQIDRIEQDIHDMKRGIGFVTERSQGRLTVEGQYP